MSIALPKASVVFGSVAPPQGDIIDLNVHLGCSTEISSFECTLQNWDKKYSSGGTYPIVEGSSATISIGRDPNCPLLLTGLVEETDPESRAVEHYIVIRGRCNGEQLFRRHVTKSWDNVKGEVVVKYVIDNYTSLSHVRNSVELIEDTDTTYVRLDYENTPVFDIIKYIAETADKAGAIGYDFRIAPDGKFEFFPKNSKTSSVDLSERLEIGRPKRSITRVKNKITIYGAPEKTEPSDGDAWTESLDDWTAEIGSLVLGSSVPPDFPKVGAHFIKGLDSGNVVKFKRSLPNPVGHQKLKFYAKRVNIAYETAAKVRLLAPDDSNYFEANMEDKGDWVLNDIPLGRKQEYDAIWNPNGFWTKVGNPSWSNIQYIQFYGTWSAGGGEIQIDGSFFAEGRWRATVEDSASQTQYGLRERQPEIDEELHSDAECECRAKALLDFLKDLITTPSVRSTVIDYGTTPILAADKTHIVLPNENIDADYRLFSVEYRFSDQTTLKIDLELSQEPLLLADFIYGFRKSIQKLDKYKASASGGGGLGGGGGGGGGMVQHANEWHDPDMALATHNHNLADLSEKSHASLTNVSADQHGDTKVRSKVVDESAIGDNKILVYKVTGDKLVYEDKPSGGSGGIKPVNSDQINLGYGYVRYVECPIAYTLQSNESIAQIRFPACTIKYLACKALVNTLDLGGTIRLRKNGASFAGAPSLSIPAAGSTNCQDLDVAVADGDLMDIKIDTSISSSGSATIIIIVGIL